MLVSHFQLDYSSTLNEKHPLPPKGKIISSPGKRYSLHLWDNIRVVLTVRVMWDEDYAGATQWASGIKGGDKEVAGKWLKQQDADLQEALQSSQ